MALQKLYRKPGKKYKTEMRPSRIDIFILPLVVCFLISIVVWSYATGHNRPQPETPPANTQPPVAEATPDPAASLPTASDAQPAEM